VQAEEQKAYEKLKFEFQLWTLGMGALGCATASYVNGQEAAVSYGIGVAAGLAYLRLLGKSVDAGARGVLCCTQGREAWRGWGAGRVLLWVPSGLVGATLWVPHAASPGPAAPPAPTLTPARAAPSQCPTAARTWCPAQHEQAG
jgi:hypothetical protein